MKRRLVILESPYAGADQAEIARNVAFARACVRDSLNRGEAPIASHLLYTQPGVLRDEVPDERLWGIEAGLAWRRVAEASVVYTDFGLSAGMRKGMESALLSGLPVEKRQLRPLSKAAIIPQPAYGPFPAAHGHPDDMITAAIDALTAARAPTETVAALIRWHGPRLAQAAQDRAAQ